MRWNDLRVALLGALVGVVMTGCWWIVDGAPGDATARADWRPAVVKIRSTRCDGTEVRGSGVVVDGRVLTNVHVVDGAQAVRIVLPDGDSRRPIGLSTSTRVDLAALDAGDLPVGLPLGDGLGELVLAGYPRGERYTETTVRVAGTTGADRFPDPARAWRLDREVIGGQSGSPVVDAGGGLAALLYGRAVDGGNGLAITAADLRTELPALTPRPLADC